MEASAAPARKKRCQPRRGCLGRGAVVRRGEDDGGGVIGKRGHWGLNCVPSHSDVEALTLKMTVFGNGAFREVIQVP